MTQPRTGLVGGIRDAVKRGAPFRTLQHWRQLLRDPDYRRSDQDARAEFDRFCREHQGRSLRYDLTPAGLTSKTAIVVSMYYPPFVPLEAWAVKALQMAAFSTVFLAARRVDLTRYYRLAGARSVVSWSDYPTEGDPGWVDNQLAGLNNIPALLGLRYEGVHVGRFAVASVMRHLKRGQLDTNDPATRDLLRGQLRSSVRHVLAGARLLDDCRPDSILFTDRGYSGQGELFDLALYRGIDTIAWGDSYRSNLLIFKRYHPGNERDHLASLSAETWRQLLAMRWRPEYGREVREVIRDSYESQDWFSSYGVQFGKRLMARQEIRTRLGLSPADKTAVIFPHILWDGSFFSGEDLFEGYTQWFVETLKAAAANPEVKWVVKLHPGHVVKSRREQITEKPAELQVVEQVLGVLPDHIRLIHPEDEVSTFSLYDAVDYAVTVRGTVGMEAALFGVPVVTAGTGRYDRRGFTLDSGSREDYLRTLATLHTRSPLTAEQIELAERFAYGVFLCRPLRLRSISLGSRRDALATAQIDVHCRSREDWLQAPDMRLLAEWLANGRDEDMLSLPEAATGKATRGE